MTCLLIGLSTEIRAARFLVPLSVEAPLTDDDRPGMVGDATRWQVDWSGGVAPFRFYFYLADMDFDKKRLMQKGREPVWNWIPDQPGRYRVIVEVEDDRGMIAESDWSQDVYILPALNVEVPQSHLAPPVMSRMEIPWTASAEGGAPPYRFAYQWREVDGEPSEEVRVEDNDWTWTPDRAGNYQVRAVVEDRFGHRAESNWTAPWTVNPVFQVVEISPDRILPVADPTAEIRWHAEVEGGAGAYSFRFELYRNDELLQSVGTEERQYWTVAGWDAGRYRVRTIVTDSLGNRVEGWSESYRIGLRKVAILPVYDLSGEIVPLDEMHRDLENRLGNLGFEILPDRDLYEFMRENRWRHTAYLPSDMAAGLRNEFAVDAVVLTGILDYQNTKSPRIALVSRLVGTGPDLPVLWTFGHAAHGEADPGLLNLKRVYDVSVLTERAFTALETDLAATLSGEKPLAWRATVALPAPEGTSEKEEDAIIRIAVFPFANHTEVERGGEVLASLLLVELARRPNINVVEPGAVRERLLKYRIIAPQGPSRSDLHLLSLDIDAELLFTGALTHYRQSTYDPVRNPPEVGYFLKVFNLGSRTLVEQYANFGKGDENVYFYDYGRYWTVYDLNVDLLAETLDRWHDTGPRKTLTATPEN